ncbi:MAG: caspase family protein [Smithellaceae bacterium]
MKKTGVIKKYGKTILPGVLLVLSIMLITACAVTPRINVKTGGMTIEVNKQVPPVFTVDYSPDGKSVVSRAWDNTARLWDVIAGKEIRKFKGHTGGITGVDYAPNGKTIASISNDDTIRIWDIATGNEIKKISDLKGTSGKVVHSQDGKYVLGFKADTWSGSEIIVLYDIESAQVVKEFSGDKPAALWLGKKGRISPDGKNILIRDRNSISLKEIATEREIWKTTTGKSSCLPYFMPNGRQLCALCQDVYGFGGRMMKFIIMDAVTGNQIREFGTSVIASGALDLSSPWNQIWAITFSPDSRFALTGDLGGRYKIWDLSTGAMVRQLKIANELEGNLYNIVPSAAFSPDGRTAVVESLASTRICDTSTGEELASMIAFEDGEWLVITPNGYYNSSEKGDQYMKVTVGGKAYSIAQLRESFYRPDLVQYALAGGSIKEYRKMADIKPPPIVVVVDTPATVDKSDAAITLKITDAGGGIGDVRLYLNGSAVMLDSARGVKVVAANQNEIQKTYKLKLSSGLNVIKAIAFNADNTMQSNDVVQEITAAFKAVGRPSLYALVIGINEYKNPKLQLNYAVADATLFANTLKKGASPLFEKVEVKTLSSKEETTRENILKELKAMQSLNPDDLFVLYVASHGTVDDGEYFLITSNVGSTRTERLRTDAIGQSVFKGLIGNIPATKKMIIIDTCNAGALGEAIQVAMLTRGMSEDTAMKILGRAVGSTILSASTSMQEALEGYQGHGLFTYVLTEGLKGKADKGNTGYVKTTELADYVDNEVPPLAEKIFKKAQYPTISISGQAFPIGKVR